jgi:glycosyltransferase involved in cell wall biosynthesis
MGGASRELVLNDAEIHTLAPLGAPNTARDDEWSSPNLEDLKKAKLLDARAFTNRSTNQLPLEILLNEPGEIGAFARSTFNGLGETEPSDASQLYSQIDVIAVTTNRFRSVAELLRSIRLHLPQELNITVVVQSKDSARWRKLKKKYRANFIHVAEDLGLSECRNLAIKETSRGLIFLMDDDFQIDERCRLDAAIGIMIRHPEISVLGGNLLDVEHWDAPRDLEVSQGFAMHMLSDKDRLTWLRLEDAPRIRKFVNPVDYYELCDVVDNFALMRRMPVFDAGARWNPELKIGAEHQDFYVTLKRLGISGVARTNCLKVRNVRVQSRKFKKMRNRTDHYFNLFFRGLGLVSFTIIGERLRAFSTDGTSAYMEQPGMAPIFPPNQGAK